MRGILKQAEQWPFRVAVPIKDIVPSDLNWLEPSSPFQSSDDVPAPGEAGSGSGSGSYPMHNDERSGRWFHVTKGPVAPGTKLVPQGGPGLHARTPEDWSGKSPTRNRQNHVWLAPNYTKAKFWHSVIGPEARIYEVKPGDKPQRWNYTGSEGWVAPHAHVIRDVTPSRQERRNPKLDWQQSVNETYATGIPGRYNE